MNLFNTMGDVYTTYIQYDWSDTKKLQSICACCGATFVESLGSNPKYDASIVPYGLRVVGEKALEEGVYPYCSITDLHVNHVETKQGTITVLAIGKHYAV